ncbi:MAG: hypothetical protein M3P46_04220 [Actinomycetota bacterium]|nr:hypothetical protein [Actinomycetota bacterium]
MTDPTPEVVQPSPQPDAGVSTGTGGGGSDGATPPPAPAESAGTGGLGTQAEQQGHSAHEGAPYDLSGDAAPGTDARSDSGT